MLSLSQRSHTLKRKSAPSPSGQEGFSRRSRKRLTLTPKESQTCWSARGILLTAAACTTILDSSRLHARGK